ncbi:endonuclease/exonuclease/phosphatase family protein [Xenorhabdus sp. KJ12.1]|uniref:endonuclease/exonuclease/phosphatase family protein n=1 Tax=Xenorhabdus sp. KJ12.1 TaxID=1851571 RepID=UPI000C04BFFB|nr:endonuclease/exonuclease/phosphatase family protein [Xenorhabdus sp. KJ12.1]PHM69086.1 hypothetical protein Xekj_02816 [Xenorhabdus sp. KJ12.1]
MSNIIIYILACYVFFISLSSQANEKELKSDKKIYHSNDNILLSYNKSKTGDTTWIGIWKFKSDSNTHLNPSDNNSWHQYSTHRPYKLKYIIGKKGIYTLNALTLGPGRYIAFLLKGKNDNQLSHPVIFDIADKNNNIQLKALTLNIWQEGTQVTGGYGGIVNTIINSNADIISLSEVRNYHSDFTSQLSKSLNDKGYKYYTYRSGNDVGILSKYPINQHSDINSFTKASINISGENIEFYAGHLDYHNYATYLPRGYDANNWSELPNGPDTNLNDILNVNNNSGRPASIQAFIPDAKNELNNKKIVIMAGDFNEPSWLDWTEATKELFDHHGAIVPWTSTKLLAEAGYLDTYRTKYPDPVKYPGFTWVANNPDVAINKLTWAPKADERDRIDYIFYYPSPQLLVKDAFIVGPSSSIVKSQRVKESSDDKFVTPKGVWPSDHKGVLITFNLKIK